MQLLALEREERAESIFSPYPKRDPEDEEGEEPREEAASCIIADEDDERDSVPIGVLTLVIVRSR